MDVEFFGTFVDREGRSPVAGGGRLGDDLDCHMIAGYKVLGLEDHPEGTMVERRNGFISSIEHNTLVNLVAHTIHGEESWDKIRSAGQREAKVDPVAGC